MTHLSPNHRSVLLAVAGPLLLMAAGCGSGSGISDGARVAVYVSEPLCGEAEAGLARKGPEAGGVKVGVVCLPAAERKGGRLDLARAGAEARRATQDSTTVGFVVPPGREVRFTRTILEEADIAVLVGESGADAMRSVLADLEGRGSGSPREAVEG